MGYVIFLAVVIASVRSVSSEIYDPDPNVKCYEEKQPRMRTFYDLNAYKNNTDSFIMSAEGFRGNYVDFIITDFGHLTENMFLTQDSPYIIGLQLDNKHIKDIQNGAFNYLDCLMYLDLQNNRIRDVNVLTFYPLHNLKFLNLSGNSLRMVMDRPFQELKDLRVLDLSYNKIKVIGDEAFINLNNLVHLNLSYNELNLIPSHILSETPNLETLTLRSNTLFYGPEIWVKLTKLRYLDLGENMLEEFDFASVSSVLNVADLFLDCNFIKDLDVVALKQRFEQLQYLDINNNLFRCAKLKSILKYLDNTNVVYRGVEKSRNNVEGIFCSDNGTQATCHEIHYAVKEEQTDIYIKYVREKARELITEKNGLLIFGTLLLGLFLMYYLIRLSIVNGMINLNWPDQRNYSDMSTAESHWNAGEQAYLPQLPRVIDRSTFKFPPTINEEECAPGPSTTNVIIHSSLAGPSNVDVDPCQPGPSNMNIDPCRPGPSRTNADMDPYAAGPSTSRNPAPGSSISKSLDHASSGMDVLEVNAQTDSPKSSTSTKTV